MKPEDFASLDSLNPRIAIYQAVNFAHEQPDLNVTITVKYNDEPHTDMSGLRLCKAKRITLSLEKNGGILSYLMSREEAREFANEILSMTNDPTKGD